MINPGLDKFRPIFRGRKLCLEKKKKSLDLQIYSQIGKTMKKLLWIPNTRENRCTCDILMLICLMVSRLLYQLMDWEIFNPIPAGTQYSSNIRWAFPQRCNVSSIHSKFVFVLKAYDLTITNVDLLPKSSNHKAMLPEYSKNILRISVSKIF